MWAMLRTTTAARSVILYAGDHVDLAERIARYPGRRDRGARRWLVAEGAVIDRVHAFEVFHIVQVHVALQHFAHRRPGGLQLRFDGIENTLRMNLDVALFVIANARNENQITV